MGVTTRLLAQQACNCSVDVPASGSVFPPGTTTVTCTATDKCGNRDKCSFTVTVTQDDCHRFVQKPVMKFTGVSGSNACFDLTLVFQNLGGATVRYVYLIASQPCVVFQPPVIDLTLPAFGGSTLASNAVRTLTVPFKVAPGCPLPHSVTLGLFDTDFRECCAKAFQLPFTSGLAVTGFDSGVVVTAPTDFALRTRASGDVQPVRVRLLADGRELASGPGSNLSATYHFPAVAPGAVLVEAVLADDSVVTSDILFALIPPPKEGGTAPEIAIKVLPSGGLNLRFTTEIGREYRIESTDSLGTGGWGLEESITSDGREVDFDIEIGAGAAEARFFRVLAP